MKGLDRRLLALEARTPGQNGSLDHLTDEELEQVAFDLIRRFADAGVVLPDDWRVQYNQSCIRFLQWLEREAKELAVCA